MVGRTCTRDVAAASPDDSVRTAARRMRDRNIGTLVVVDDENRPVGMMTDRDLALGVVALDCDPSTTLVKDVMTPDPAVVTESTPIEAALAHMRSRACRRLPVVDDAGRLVGIVTLDDVLRLLSEEFFRIGGLLGRELPRTAGTGGRADPLGGNFPAER